MTYVPGRTTRPCRTSSRPRRRGVRHRPPDDRHRIAERRTFHWHCCRPRRHAARPRANQSSVAARSQSSGSIVARSPSPVAWSGRPRRGPQELADLVVIGLEVGGHVHRPKSWHDAGAPGSRGRGTARGRGPTASGWDHRSRSGSRRPTRARPSTIEHRDRQPGTRVGSIRARPTIGAGLVGQARPDREQRRTGPGTPRRSSTRSGPRRA